jgi:hypothetical protein
MKIQPSCDNHGTQIIRHDQHAHSGSASASDSEYPVKVYPQNFSGIHDKNNNNTVV